MGSSRHNTFRHERTTLQTTTRPSVSVGSQLHPLVPVALQTEGLRSTRYLRETVVNDVTDSEAYKNVGTRSGGTQVT